jgi:hypothetical protein
MTKNVQIDGSKITDWDSFHDCFSGMLGFPGFYGRNMDAWNDCMTCLDPQTGMRPCMLLRGISWYSAYRRPRT